MLRSGLCKACVRCSAACFGGGERRRSRCRRLRAALATAWSCCRRRAIGTRAAAAMLIPTVKWAQRSNCVYLTIDVQDSKGARVCFTRHACMCLRRLPHMHSSRPRPQGALRTPATRAATPSTTHTHGTHAQTPQSRRLSWATQRTARTATCSSGPWPAALTTTRSTRWTW
jgi:hypothetical protein